MRLVLALLTISGVAAAQDAFEPPKDVEYSPAAIMSEGVRMHAERFWLKSNAGKKLPTILMATFLHLELTGDLYLEMQNNVYFECHVCVVRSTNLTYVLLCVCYFGRKKAL